MDARWWSTTGCAGIVLSGLLTVLAPGPSVGGQLWPQQAILLVHLPQAGGQVFTTDHFISASETSAAVNIKCFNDASQRVGSADGGTLPLASAGPGGRTALVTALSLQVTTDPLFTGIGWCWANNVLNEAGFNVE